MKYDIEKIKAYIYTYNTGVPEFIIWGTLLIIGISVIFLYYRRSNFMTFLRNASWSFFIGYLFLVFCTTVVFRESSDHTKCYFLPLRSYRALYNSVIAEIILNVILFVPIGIFLGGALKTHNWGKVLFAGFGISMAIEVVQFLTRRGICNIDDVIHNSLGCCLGYAVFRLVTYGKRCQG